MMVVKGGNVLVIFNKKTILAWIEDAPLDSATYHIKNGYPALLKDWDSGLLSAVLVDIPEVVKSRPELYAVVDGKIVERPDLVLERAKAEKRAEIINKRRDVLWASDNALDLVERLVLKYPMEFGTFTVQAVALTTKADVMQKAVNDAKIPEDIEKIKVDFTATAAEVKP
jgi:hypothetical protein